MKKLQAKYGLKKFRNPQKKKKYGEILIKGGEYE